jgi:subtilisin family serine protease
MLIFLLLSLLTSVSVSAGGFSELEEDCYIFNTDPSCRPPPKIIKPIPKPIKKVFVRSNFNKDEVVLLYPAGSDKDAQRVAKQYGLKTIEKVNLASIKTGMLLANTGGKNPLKLSKLINNVEKNIEATTNNAFGLASLDLKPASKNAANYSMNATGVDRVHEVTKGKGIKICMVDTPIDIYHSSFSKAHIDTLDFTDYTPDTTESLLHGTLVAGVIVSQNKHIGISPNSHLLSVGAFGYSKKAPHRLQGSSSDIAKAINSCIQYKADIINLSFTGGRDSLLEKVVKKAIEKGIVVVAAAGNGGHWGSTIYPALIPGVLVATATDKNRKLYELANKGSFVDIAAPGVNVLTLAPGDKYELASGTSISTAHVTGITALLLSQKRAEPITKTLSESALDLGKPGRDQEFGDGLISASRALKMIKRGRARSSVGH